MTAILNQDPPGLSATNPEIPPGLERLVRRCLEKKPEERFQSARDIRFALEAISGLEAEAPSALARHRSGSRARLPWILTGVLFTRAKRKDAATLVKEGVSVSLARDLDKQEAVDNNFPFEHVMGTRKVEEAGQSPFAFPLDAHLAASADRFTISYHGYAHTQLDSLCHMFIADFPRVRHPLSAPIPCRDAGLSSWRRPLWTGLRAQGSCDEAA